MTGGDEGEGAKLVSITPTLTLPRQGGGKYKDTPQSRRLSGWGIENLIKKAVKPIDSNVELKKLFSISALLKIKEYLIMSNEMFMKT